jgi:predicted nuclease with TOPRIM domain
MAKSKYPDSVRGGFKNLKAATATIKSLYEETSSLKESLKITQDELENWKNKYHETDKAKGILDARIKTTTFAEALKFIFSSLVAAYGINLVSDGKKLGYIWIAGSAVLYVAILYLARGKSND